MKDLTQKYGPNCIGVVLRILDQQTLIISCNATDLNYNLSVGDKISVYEYSEPLIDLDGNELCRFEYIKDSLEVMEVTNRYSVCKKNKQIEKTLPSFALSPLLKATTTEYVPLKVKEEDIEPVEISNRYIKKGDPVKLS